MEFLESCIIFIIVLFLYMHVADVFKKNEDLEIYETDYTTPDKLQEVCALKQPFVFQYNVPTLPFTDGTVEIRDTNDYVVGRTTIDPVPLETVSAVNLCKTDTNKHLFGEGPINPTHWSTIANVLNPAFRPFGTVQTRFDMWFGSQGCRTPLRYHTDTRKFMCCVKGIMHVRLTPWRSKMYLHPVEDYENYEFWSPVGSKPCPQFADEHAKLRFLDIDVLEGQVLYLPPYWWYSIEYSTSATENLAYIATYNNIASLFAYAPSYLKYYLQQQNIVYCPRSVPSSSPDGKEPKTGEPTTPVENPVSPEIQDSINQLRTEPTA